jgi:hypothetical protein
MPNSRPTVIRRREVADDELRQMLITAAVAGDTADFFGRFEYFFPGDPFATLLSGEALLGKCRKLAPDAYEKLRKGTPFYWLAWGAFEVHDYETAAFYIDAAVSEDLKAADDDGADRGSVSSPALLFFLIDDRNPNQALMSHVRLLRDKIDRAVNDYNARPDADPTQLTFIDVQNSLLRTAILKGKEQLRTLVTTFISYFLEWDHRSELITLRTEQGTAEAFFIHLFKGCVLFESLLKANSKRRPTTNTLGKILLELQADLGFGAKSRINNTGGG